AGVVIGLDSSFSMGHKPGVRSRFDLARDRTREVLLTISSGSPVTLVQLGNKPRILLRNAAYDSERFEAVLKSLEPLDENLNLEVCMDELNVLVREMRAPSRECYIVTDAQSAVWNKVSDNARGAMDKISKAGSLLFVPTGSGDCENIAITRFALASGILRKNSEARYVVDVRNEGRLPRSNVSVQLFLNNGAVDEHVIESILPGKTESISLFCRFDQAGVFSISARLGSDALAIDNARYAVADIKEIVRVLCVDGAPSDEPYGSETDFLIDALLPLGAGGADSAVPSPLRVDKVRVDDLQISAVSASDIVILANVPELVREHAIALADFVRRGGGLMIFLGDKVNADLMNSRMQDANGNMLLPAKLMEVVNATQDKSRDPTKPEGAVLSAKMPDHQLTRILKTLPPDQLNQIHFDSYFKVAPGKNAAVLLRLAPSDDPLLVEQSFGRGRVLLLTTTADRGWSDMPVHPAYLMLVQQAVTYMTRKASESPVMVSEAVTFDVPQDDEARTATVVNPKGTEISVRVSDRDGGKAGILPSADTVGIYQARFAKDGLVAKAAANPDPVESDLTALEGEELRSAASRLPVRLVKDSENVRDIARECRFGRELWPMLLLLALCALAIEAVLARRFVRRMEDVT
ncbi:MAG: VWA domain-containing protein, partial [bacterium]